MLAPFFRTAMISPARQLSLRRAVVAHVLFLSFLGFVAATNANRQTMTMVGQILVATAIVEAAVLCGWRLTQMPKSQALEFLLTSPVQPRRLFAAEAAVGLSRYLYVQISGLPVLHLLVASGLLQLEDLGAVFALPLVWGMAAGLGLTMWAYETPGVKAVGQVVAIVGVIAYLVVGVLAGERLRDWLMALPPSIGQVIFDGYQKMHDDNPFGVVAYWMFLRRNPIIAGEMLRDCLLLGLALSALFFARSAYRLRGHFADRHYRPYFTDRPDEVDRIGEQPLSWWAVKRVMEFSGRVNIWLAGGFSVIYAAYILAGDAWPPYFGKLVFEIFEKMGGVPGLITGLVILAAVPAAFQYGLWDSSTEDRCRRLELLLLTELNGRDYWNASLSAAVKRGRGYLFIAALLWSALLLSGRIDLSQFAVSVAAGLLVWCLAFTIGFLAFSRGRQSSGLGSLLTLGLPLIAFTTYNKIGPEWAVLFPHGAVYATLLNPVGWTCLVLIPLGGLTWWLRKMALRRCEADLRSWYDLNQGLRVAE